MYNNNTNNFEFKLTEDRNYIEIVSYPSTFMLQRLKSHFRKFNKKAREDEAYKKGRWDGFDNFIEEGKYIPFELWDEIKVFLNSVGLKFNCQEVLSTVDYNIKKEDVEAFATKILPPEFVLRHYQLHAVWTALKMKYCSMHIATAAGKTIISFMTFAYLKKELDLVDRFDNKFLLIVPTPTLVHQTIEKFNDTYRTKHFTFNAVGHTGDSKASLKELDKADFIAVNYQSIDSIPEEILKRVRVINVDEAHTGKCDTIVNFLARYRTKEYPSLLYKFGWSGTLKKKSELEFSQNFYNRRQLGPFCYYYPARQLIADGFAPEVHVKKINVDYNHRIDEQWIKDYIKFRDKNIRASWYYNKRYTMERECILKDERGVQLVLDIVKGLDKNALILYNDSKNGFGDRICKGLTDIGRDVRQICGETKDKARAKYIEEFEAAEDMFMVASFGTFAAGIDTKNLHYLVLAESFKSEDRIGQAVGRLLRNFEGKTRVMVIDIVHGLYNHTVNQYVERKDNIYDEEEYPITEETVFI